MRSDTAFKGVFVNQAMRSLHKVSFKNTVPTLQYDNFKIEFDLWP